MALMEAKMGGKVLIHNKKDICPLQVGLHHTITIGEDVQGIQLQCPEFEKQDAQRNFVRIH